MSDNLTEKPATKTQEVTADSLLAKREAIKEAARIKEAEEEAAREAARKKAAEEEAARKEKDKWRAVIETLQKSKSPVFLTLFPSKEEDAALEAGQGTEVDKNLYQYGGTQFYYFGEIKLQQRIEIEKKTLFGRKKVWKDVPVNKNLYCKTSILQSSAEAQYLLGACYAEGKGVTQDYVKALKWYKLAAVQDSAEAQYRIGKCYENGYGVAEDGAEAAKWYTLAAELGNTEAINRLGYRAQCSIKDGEAIVEKQPKRITTAYIPASITVDGKIYPVTSICKEAFEDCKNLETVFFAAGSKLTSIGDWAFHGCTSLASITIPSSVTIIGNSVFYRCRNLATVTFEAGSKLASIGYDAFHGCTSLAAINIPSSVTSIGGDAFNGCTSLASITADPANANYQSIDGNLYNKAGTELVLYAPGKTATSFTIPSSVTSIGRSAFDGCTSLTAINIPSSVTSIGGWAFSGCTALAAINIPSSVTSIGWYAFDGCTALASITVDPANANYQLIDGNLYNKAGTELVLYAPSKTATSFSIPSSVTSIGSFAFGGCTSLTSITIPSSVTSIGGYAFSGCTSLTIYAKAKCKPSGWNSNWNENGGKVRWG